MPSFLPHIVAPALLAAAFIPVSKRTSLLLAPAVWLPDLDYLIPSEHRAVTHSAFIPLALFTSVVVLWRRRSPEAPFWSFAISPGAPVVLSLLSFYIASHLVMDVFAGGVVLLWPFTSTNFFLDFSVVLDTGTNTFTPSADAGTEPGPPALAPRYEWVSNVDTAVAAFLGACLVGWLIVRVWRALRVAASGAT